MKSVGSLRWRGTANDGLADIWSIGMKRIANTMLSAALAIIIVHGAVSTATAQKADVILQSGEPPLTQSMVDKTLALLKWALEVEISEEYRSKLQQVLAHAWQSKSKDEMKSTVDIVNIHDKLMQMSPNEREARRPPLREAILQNLRNEPDDEMSRILVSMFEASRAKTTVPIDRANSSPPSNDLRVGPDGFTGVHRMLRPRAININSTTPESGYWIEYITFLPNGNVYWSLPPEGLLDFDAALTARTDPDDWGTYTVKNGEIHVLRGPSKKLYVITRTGDRLNNPPSLGKGTFRPIPNADGLKLEGNYRRSESEPTITFSVDGRFRDGGVFRNFGTLVRPDGSHYQDDGIPGSGTYIIQQNTLELRYSDGRVKRHPFIVFPENLAKKPAVDGFILRREERFQRY
jgi:hypothetical protein